MLKYEEIKKQKIKENLDYFKQNFRNKDFQLKILKHCIKFEIPKDEIIKRIEEGDLITISLFSKDPSKQNFYEKTAAEFISNINEVHNFKNLPGSGKNTIFIVDDEIGPSKIKKQTEFEIKSIDFSWEFATNNIACYAFHKYIKENGGAQDNQFNDVLSCIKAAKSKTKNSNHKVLFICDGEYFIDKKMNILKKEIENNNHVVLRIEEVENYLNNLIK